MNLFVMLLRIGINELLCTCVVFVADNFIHGIYFEHNFVIIAVEIELVSNNSFV